MKKLLSVLFVVLLLFVLGCGGSDSSLMGPDLSTDVATDASNTTIVAKYGHLHVVTDTTHQYRNCGGATNWIGDPWAGMAPDDHRHRVPNGPQYPW